MLDWIVLFATIVGVVVLVGGFLVFVTMMIEVDGKLQQEKLGARPR